MKYVDEFRSGAAAQAIAREVNNIASRPWTIMEICGGQTHAIVKSGLEALLPEKLTLVHGPGCPVCVTPLELIDKAIVIAQQSDVVFTSFGDMLRVPGSADDLLSIKAKGGDVRIVYSPLDAVAIARENKNKRVVFFAVGFETTAPANGMAVWQAKKERLDNFSILCSHVLVPPAIRAILSSPQNKVQGFLAAGHVCSVMGYEEYEPIVEKFKVPIVVTGFEPVDILQGILMTVKLLESETPVLQNQYSRVVKREGNIPAKKLLQEVFEKIDRKWRGIGSIPLSGYRLRKEFAAYDAENIFDVGEIVVNESPLCIAGAVLQGLEKPDRCPAFRKECSPEHPLGALMVSSEGACAAYFRFAT